MVDGSDPRVAFCIGEYPRLVGTLTLYTGNGDLAVELAQEALARACRHWHRIETMRAPGAWVHRVGINLANSAFSRRRAERKAVERAASLARSPSDSTLLDEVADVRAAILRLPTRQRTALVLRYYRELPVRETAELMRCKEGTVKALTHQAIEGLRRMLFESEKLEVHDVG